MKADPFYPFSDRVVIQPEKPEERTKGGIYMPDTVREEVETAIGLVRFVGPGDWTGRGIPVGKMQSKVGMRVQYYTLRAVKIGDLAGESNDLVIVNEQDVIGCVPKPEVLDAGT